jgi:eukaryotic-like serine/threonine-protein kinase
MIGYTLSHYRILSKLGQGGMGVVYEAEDTRLGRRVAIKMLPPDACSDGQAMQRFLREARIISSLTHPHICTLYDIGEHQGQQFMVMELIDGESLKARIARGPLPVEDAIQLSVQIADALDAAHGRGVVHRDIKPANLFVTSRGQIKVLDFGVAKLSQGGGGREEVTETAPNDELMTTAGTAVGTVAYMSPEQARGQEIDARSDLFSLGAVMFEMVTGTTPFSGVTPAVVFEGILTKPTPVPSTLEPSVPTELDRIVLEALEKDREMRYQSAADLRADLKRLERDIESGRTAVPRSGSVLATATPRPRTAAGAWLVGAPLVTASVIALVFLVLWQSTRAPALTSRDLVVLTDFVNRTGDTMFDDTLAEALALQLRQSPFLNLLTDQQAQSTLRLMGRDPMEPITPEIGAEVCQRVGARATLGGAIASLGSAYVLTLNARDCVTGSVLAEAQVQAAGKETVLVSLGGAASRLREQLGETLASLERYDAPIEEGTTPSLDALKAYSQGILTRRVQGDFASVPFFARAIELDPNFALAHARLGTVYTNLGEIERSRLHTTRAYEMRDRVSERERYYIDARYFSAVSRDTDRAIEVYRLWKTTYPNDVTPYINLGSLHRGRGEIEEAVSALEEAVRLAPDEPIARLNLAFAYLDESRFEEARTSFQSVLSVADSTQARIGLIVLGIFTRDEALIDAQVAATSGRRDEGDVLVARAAGALYPGHVGQARRLFEELARRHETLVAAQRARADMLSLAINLALVGDLSTARQWVQRVRVRGLLGAGTAEEEVTLAGLIGDDALARDALDAALAGAGDGADARMRQRVMRASAAEAHGRTGDALDELGSVPFERRYARAVFLQVWLSAKVGQWDEVVRAASWLLDGPGPDTHAVWAGPALARTLRAQAYARLGRLEEARAAYEDFFQFWKDADPDVPILQDARREYAKLGS